MILGTGAGYLYPHAYRDHWVAQQYLPGSLQGRVFYRPSDQGYEATIRDQVARRREEQLAAVMEAELSLEEEMESGGKGPSTQKTAGCNAPSAAWGRSWGKSGTKCLPWLKLIGMNWCWI